MVPSMSVNPEASMAPPWDFGHAMAPPTGVNGPLGVLDVAAPTQ